MNPPPSYKEDLVNALVAGDALPSYESEKATEPRHYEDLLLASFARRAFDDGQDIMQLQYERYGRLDTELFYDLVVWVAQSMQSGRRTTLSQSAQQLLNNSKPIHRREILPDNPTFQAWRTVQNEYFAGIGAWVRLRVPKGVTVFTTTEVVDLFNDMLDEIGLSKAGWQAKVNKKANFISIAKARRRILIAGRPVTISRLRLLGLLLHEVMIHATWAENNVVDNTHNEEGVGVFVEQLSLRTFHLLRLYRHLAICLGAGVDGCKRTAREVYELLVELRMATHPHTSPDATRLYVAKEVARVYRGLPTDTPGLVYIRDKVYMENNIALWSKLKQGEPSIERYTSVVAPWIK